MAKDTRRWDIYSRICAQLDIPEDPCEAKRDCWPWTGAVDGSGYPKIRIDGRFVGAHRWLYEFFFGKVPPGLELDHVCRHRACCNPLHLEAVPHRVNCLRGVSPAATNARKTHCKRGHELSGDNIRYEAKGEGGLGRRCVVCERARGARRTEAKRAARAAQVGDVGEVRS